MNASRLAIAVVLAALGGPRAAQACHGPGTGAGGVFVWSANPVVAGVFTISLRGDYSKFESLSAEEIEALTRQVSGDHAHIHVVDQALLGSLAVGYGITDNLEVDALFGYYGSTGVGEGHLHHDGSYGFHDYGDVDGLTDSWFLVKWRLHHAGENAFALIGGVKAPIGEDDVTVGDEPIDQALQPGTGAWDYTLALAYTRAFGDRYMLDASGQYILRGEANDYQIGDQALVGADFAGRMTGSTHAFPQFWLFGEATVRWLAENEEGGEEHVNSGGTVLFLTPGIRADFTRTASATLGFQAPVVQEQNDVQQELDYKIMGNVMFSF
jgi:hypothetical protein